MKALFTDEQLKAGTKIKGNVNGAVMEILKIETPTTATPAERNLFTFGKTAIIKDCKTGHIFHYGLEALKRCDITILDSGCENENG